MPKWTGYILDHQALQVKIRIKLENQFHHSFPKQELSLSESYQDLGAFVGCHRCCFFTGIVMCKCIYAFHNGVKDFLKSELQGFLGLHEFSARGKIRQVKFVVKRLCTGSFLKLLAGYSVQLTNLGTKILSFIHDSFMSFVEEQVKTEKLGKY